MKFLSGITTVAEVKGIKDVSKDDLTMGDVEKLLNTEKFIERITGLRTHIDELYEEDKEVVK